MFYIKAHVENKDKEQADAANWIPKAVHVKEN